MSLNEKFSIGEIVIDKKTRKEVIIINRHGTEYYNCVGVKNNDNIIRILKYNNLLSEEEFNHLKKTEKRVKKINKLLKTDENRRFSKK